MFLFFDIFHEISDLLDGFHNVVEAVDEFLPKSEKQRLEDDLHDMQCEFRNLRLSADMDFGAGRHEVGAYLETLLRHGDTFRRHAQRIKRFDLVREIDDLQAQIKASPAYRASPTPRPALPAELAALVSRPPVFVAPLHYA